MNALETCRSRLANLPAAISGSGGHPATFSAACECVRLGLNDAAAMIALREYNRRCEPPWSEKELAHKLGDARRKVMAARPYHQPRPSVRVKWHLERRPANVLANTAPMSPVRVVVAPDPTPDPESSLDTIVSEVPEASEPWLSLDQAAWLPIARQILLGEFEGASRSLVQSLNIGLKSINHPACRLALARLNGRV